MRLTVGITEKPGILKCNWFLDLRNIDQKKCWEKQIRNYKEKSEPI